MQADAREARPCGWSALALTLLVTAGGCGSALGAQRDEEPARVAPWPCRLVVKPTLLGVVEDGWHRSATLQRQCRDLAGWRAVVVLEWGSTDSQSHAVTRMRLTEEGVVVAHVTIPPVGEAVILVAHELEHVIERASGVDLRAESQRRGSGVWQASGGFETQRAIEVARQVADELRAPAR